MFSSFIPTSYLICSEWVAVIEQARREVGLILWFLMIFVINVNSSCVAQSSNGRTAD